MLTRIDYRNRIKSEQGLSQTRDDGLLTNALINEALNDAMRVVANDLGLIRVYRHFRAVQGQWVYPTEEGLLGIRRIWWHDDAERNRLEHMEPEQFMDGHDPTSNTGQQPFYFCYPHWQAPVFNFWAQAPPDDDYVEGSQVTTLATRTVIDSGASFGNTESGRKIKPRSVVYNDDDESYGYVDYLDITTAKAAGTAGASTSSTVLVDGGKNFVDLDVREGDIICSPSTGTVTKYAFVTDVAATILTYSDTQIGTQFSSGDSYKVGRSTEARLSIDPPHRGLRYGTNNYFSVSDPVATLTGTTFTNTRCNTGSATSAVSVGQIAIASGGSHGKISVVASGYVDVDMWIGGKPVNGEVVTVRTCDGYRIQSYFRTEKVLWIRPTPSVTDPAGEKNLHILFNDTPRLPFQDSDPVEVDDKYFDVLLSCLTWQCIKRKGNHGLDEIRAYKAAYKEEARPFMGDEDAPPRNEPLRPFSNQVLIAGDRTDVGRSGAAWDWRG